MDKDTETHTNTKADIDTIYRELKAMLAPAGGGIHVVSTGVAQTRALQRAIYRTEDDDQIVPHWHQALRRIVEAKVVVLGVPSDTGAGYVKGANMAPAIVRDMIMRHPFHGYRKPEVVDIGDIRVVPHLLSDEMVSDQQRRATQVALYGQDCDLGGPNGLPVSPLDQCARVLTHIRTLNPEIIPMVIGGDHSVGWPAFATAHAHHEAKRGRRIGLLHFDAHTDLLPERLGVRYCFATWAYHANELLGRDGRLVQVGIRSSGRDKAHWESTLGVRQYWPDELDTRSGEEIGDEIVEHFRARGVDAVYISNDIDGTDMAHAAATGTPEPGGPVPLYVRAVMQQVTATFPLVGGDMVEVAPLLASNRDAEPARTLVTATAYLNDMIFAGLMPPREGPQP